MTFTLLALSLAASSATNVADQRVRPLCQDIETRQAGSPRAARPHTLAQEPPAQRIYSVLRLDGGCSRPVPVNDRLMGNPPLPR